MDKYRVLLVVLALVICTGTAQATSLSVTAGTGTLTCNTSTGTGTGTVTLTVQGASSVSSGSYPIGTAQAPISIKSIAGLQVITPLSGGVLTSSSTKLTVTVQPTNDCSGFTGAYTANSNTWTTAAVVWQIGTTQDVTTNLTITETDTAATPLSVLPASGTLPISCVLQPGGSWLNANPSTTFTLNTTAQAYIGPTGTTGGKGSAATFNYSSAAWLTLSAPGGWTSASGTALSVPSSGGVVVTASANCASIGATLGNYKSASLTVTTAAPEPASINLPMSINVTVVGPAQLTVSGNGTSGTPLALGPYTRGSDTNMPSGTVTVTAANPMYFLVDMTTMPAWLTVNATSGNITSKGGTATLTFTVTKVADSLTPGTYPTSPPIALKVAGYASTLVYVTLTVQASASTLSLQGSNIQTLSWSPGQTLAPATITIVSSGAPIPYTTQVIAPGSNDAGALVNPPAGLAYSMGTNLTVTFNPLNFAAGTPGSTLTSTVRIKWDTTSGDDLVINFIVNIQSPSATAILTGISPSNLPSGAPAETFPVTLYGSGFVPSNNNTMATFVGVVGGTTGFVKDANIVATVNSSTMISLVITVPASDQNLPFGTAGSTVTLGVCNPNGGTGNPPCLNPSTISFTIGDGPMISGVTSGSTFAQVTSSIGVLTPYDIISIFGSNFCVSGGNGCGSSQVLNGQIVAGAYQNFVTPDTPGSASERFLQVYFCPGNSTSATVIQTPATPTSASCYAAPILFATNSQINAVVPAEAKNATSATWNLYVRFGLAVTSTTTAGSAGTSAAFNYAAASASIDPGVFIVDSSNNGAIVTAGAGPNPNAGYVTNDAPTVTAGSARIRPLLSSANVSDTVSIYMTGLGTPPTAGEPSTCASVSSYASAAGLGTSNPNLDGVVLDSSNYTTTYPPCFVAPVSGSPAGTPPIAITIGGQSVTASYIGWVASSVTGLYQVNVQLPALTSSTATELSNGAGTPVYVTQSSGAVQVPVVVKVGSTPTTQTIEMWVQPAMTITNTGAPIGDSPSLATINGAYPYAFDTVLAAGGNGTPAYALYADSLETTAVDGNYFTVASDTGIVSLSSALPVGTYTVTISATDGSPTGPALPVELITLTVVVRS